MTAALASGLALSRTVSSSHIATSRRRVASSNSRWRATTRSAAAVTASASRNWLARCSRTAYHAESARTGSSATVTTRTSLVRSDQPASIAPLRSSDRDGIERLGDRRAEKIGVERLGDDESRLDLLARQQPLGIAGDEDHRDVHRAHDLVDRGDAAVAAAQLDVGKHKVRRML